MGLFQHQRPLVNSVGKKGSIRFSVDPNGLMDFNRGKTLGRSGWLELWKLTIPHRGLAFKLTKHIHIYYGEIWARQSIIHIFQLKKLRLQAEWYGLLLQLRW